jgi:hypothetical protein
MFAFRSPAHPDAKNFYKLSYAFRSASEDIVSPDLLPVHLQAEIENLLEAADPSVQEKLTLLLRYLGKASTYPGDFGEFDYTNDYSLLGARNGDEAYFYLETLRDQGLIIVQDRTFDSTVATYQLTARGWLQLDELTRSENESSNAFIAMSFHPDRSPFEAAINNAVRGAGYNPIRIDRVEHINRIDDEIIARIRDSKFLISDFTSQRNGVYFEAGFMLGLGRPVIWLCEKSDLHNVHFDTRQYNTIDYTDAGDLADRLKFRIEAILGHGPLRN